MGPAESRLSRASPQDTLREAALQQMKKLSCEQQMQLRANLVMLTEAGLGVRVLPALARPQSPNHSTVLAKPELRCDLQVY